MASRDLKVFYRQRKNLPAAKLSPAVAKQKPHASTATGSGPDPHGEEILRQFDLDMRYGPCLGMTRMQRWERASRMGLDPPAEVAAVLSASGAGGAKDASECVWYNRI